MQDDFQTAQKGMKERVSVGETLSESPEWASASDTRGPHEVSLFTCKTSDLGSLSIICDMKTSDLHTVT